MTKSVPLELIAPCGMNCNLCLGYLREKNRCPGCNNLRNLDNKQEYRVRCIIRNCQILQQNKLKYCSSACQKFPCTRLKNLDKRYRTKYGMSMIENLKTIEKNGIGDFIRQEKKKWMIGDKIFCVHRKVYF